MEYARACCDQIKFRAVSFCTELSNLILVGIEATLDRVWPVLFVLHHAGSLCWKHVFSWGWRRDWGGEENRLCQLNGEPWLTDSSLLHHPQKEPFSSFQNYDTFKRLFLTEAKTWTLVIGILICFHCTICIKALRDWRYKDSSHVVQSLCPFQVGYLGPKYVLLFISFCCCQVALYTLLFVSPSVIHRVVVSLWARATLEARCTNCFLCVLIPCRCTSLESWEKPLITSNTCSRPTISWDRRTWFWSWLTRKTVSCGVCAGRRWFAWM